MGVALLKDGRRGELVWTDRAVAGEMETYAFGRRGTRGNVVVEVEDGEQARLLVVVERRGIVAETIVDLGPEDRLAKAEYALDGAQPVIGERELRRRRVLRASIGRGDGAVRRAAAARGPPATGPSNALSEAPNVMFQVDLYKTYIARVYVIFCEFGGELRGSYIQNLFRIGRAVARRVR